MCRNWKDVLACMVIYVVTVGLQCCVFADDASECQILLNKTKGQYFYGFDALPLSNEFTQGCATNGSASTSKKIYKENYIFHVQNDRAADIYLHINGISHQTMNTLPHYSEYKYEFALISKKDVVWIFSTENMPNSSVHYKFYVSGGSLVVPQNKINSSVTKVDKNFYSSQEILGFFTGDGIFGADKVTSFSEFFVERVAMVNVLTGFGKTPLKQGQSEFTKCVRVQNNYISPLISLQKFSSKSPSYVCQRRKISTQLYRLNKAFILDMNYAKTEKNDTKSVRLEIVGSGDTGYFFGKTVIVLRSEDVVHWRIRIVENFRSNKYVFVIGEHDKLELVDSVPNAETIHQNLNYDDDLNALSKSIESKYRCNIFSHAKYNLPLDLVFLRLSGQPESSNSALLDVRDVAYDIFTHSKNICEVDSWYLVIPSLIVKQYSLSEKNFKIGHDGRTCDQYPSGDGLEYSLSMCSSEKDDIQLSEMTLILNSASDHFYTLPDRETTSTFSYTLSCRPTSERIEGLTDEGLPHGEIAYDDKPPSKIECTEEKMMLSIPKSRTQNLNLTPIADCKDYADGEDYLEYSMLNNKKYNCGVVFENKSCKLLIPLQSGGDNADSRENSVEFLCRDSTLVESLTYQLNVYEDFGMRKKVNFPKTINFNADQMGKDAGTFHVSLSAFSDDPSLSVYISECVLWSGSTARKVLIRNNCPADESVSFVRHYGMSHRHSQHFVVQMDKFLRDYKNVELKCDVGACTTEDRPEYCVPTITSCFHLHGDACSSDDHQTTFKVASLREEHLQSGRFYFSEEIGITKSPVTTSTKGESSNATGISSPGVIVTLVFSCFLVGVVFVCGLWWIDRKSYAQSPRNNKRVDSDTSGESGRSRSTGSTKLSGSSLSSLLCSRSRKEPALPSSSKDDLELKSLINSPQSPTSHPQPLTNGNGSPMKKPSEKPFMSTNHHIAVDNVHKHSAMGFRVPADPTLRMGSLASDAKTSVPLINSQTSSAPTMSTIDSSRCLMTQKHTPHKGRSSACDTSLSTNGHLKYIPPSQTIYPSTSNAVLKWPNATLRLDESNDSPFSRDKFDKLKEVDL